MSMRLWLRQEPVSETQSVFHHSYGCDHVTRVPVPSIARTLELLPGVRWASCLGCGMVRAVDREAECPFEGRHALYRLGR